MMKIRKKKKKGDKWMSSFLNTNCPEKATVIQEMLLFTLFSQCSSCFFSIS